MKKRQKLSSQIAFVFILLIAFLMFITILTISYLYEKSQKDIVKNYSISIADNLSSRIISEQTEIRRFTNNLIAIFNNKKISTNDKIEVATLQLSNLENALYIGIYDKNGNPIDFITKNDSLPLKKLKIIRKEQNKKGFAILRESLQFRNYPIMEVGVPWQRNNKFVGYVSTGVSLKWLSDLVKELSLMYIGKYNMVFVIDSSGRIIASGDTSYVIKRLKYSPQQPMSAVLSDRVLFATETTTPGKIKAFSVLISVPSIHSGIIVNFPLKELYAPLRQIQRASVSLGVLGLILAIILSNIIARFVTKPLIKLETGLEEIAKHNFRYHISIKANNEIARLADKFNEMVDRLNQYKNELIKETKTRFHLQRYVSASLLTRLLSKGKNLLEEKPEEKRATVMFIDISNFTFISDHLRPEQITEFLNEFFKIATDIIFKHDGIIDKFIGDCVMALYGISIQWPNFEKNAVLSAIEISTTLKQLEHKFTSKYGFPMRIKAGISTGKLTVGNIGSPNRMDYTAIGPPVNLASRLESIAKDYEVLIDEETNTSINGSIKTVLIGEQAIKGFEKPVKVYRVIY